MRKLDRTAASAPSCMAQYARQHNRWEDLTGEEKEPIRDALKEVQNGLCAYCEGPLGDGGHIEHFCRQRDFPDRIFTWENLFLSCDAQGHCGHYKDRPGASYDPADLVKPDEDNPDEFLYFSPGGDVRPRGNIAATQRRKAEETIRVLNLNHGALQALRRRALAAYVGREPNILEALEGFEEAIRRQFIDEEIARTAPDPYSAVIRHFFEPSPGHNRCHSFG